MHRRHVAHAKATTKRRKRFASQYKTLLVDCIEKSTAAHHRRPEWDFASSNWWRPPPVRCGDRGETVHIQRKESFQ